MKYNRMIDISMELNERTVVWREDAPPELRPVLRQPRDAVNFTWLNFGSHAGTHVDAPFFLYKDKWTSDQIPLSLLVGECQVLDLTAADDLIAAADLQALSLQSKRVLLKTRNSYDPLLEYNPRHVSLTVDAAEWFVRQGVEVLGYDYQSFERNGENKVHAVFLSRNIIVIDNLRLSEAEAGIYQLVCLPLKVTGIDGAPARAILFE